MSKATKKTGEGSAKEYARSSRIAREYRYLDELDKSKKVARDT